MASLYTDEDVPESLVKALTALGHAVLTADADGRANQRIDDAEVLGRATILGRAVVTFNRWDFHRLHRASSNHAGIVTCTDDPDRVALAQRIDQAIRGVSNLNGRLIKIIRPNPP